MNHLKVFALFLLLVVVVSAQGPRTAQNSVNSLGNGPVVGPEPAPKRQAKRSAYYGYGYGGYGGYGGFGGYYGGYYPYYDFDYDIYPYQHSGHFYGYPYYGYGYGHGYGYGFY